MASLFDTQAPRLERDMTCGLLPPKAAGETTHAYHERLARHYYLSTIDVEGICLPGRGT